MNYGKVLTVALLGGTMLAGCGKKDEPQPALKGADGKPLPGVMQQTDGMERGGKSTATTQSDSMKSSASDAAGSAKDMMNHTGDAVGHGVDAMKDKMGMSTTQPTK